MSKGSLKKQKRRIARVSRRETGFNMKLRDQSNTTAAKVSGLYRDLSVTTLVVQGLIDAVKTLLPDIDTRLQTFVTAKMEQHAKSSNVASEPTGAAQGPDGANEASVPSPAPAEVVSGSVGIESGSAPGPVAG